MMMNAATTPAPARVRLLRWLLFGLACLLTLTALFYVEEDWRGRRAWENYKSAAAARGQPMSAAADAALIPPPVPDDQNFARTPLLTAVCDYISSPNASKEACWNVYRHLYLKQYAQNPPVTDLEFGRWYAAQPADLRVWQQNFRRMADFFQAPPATDAARDVLLALGRYEKELKEVSEASRRPHSRFPVRYEDGPAARLAHLEILNMLAQIFELRALAASALGDSASALADIETIFRLADAVKTEPLSTSQSYRARIISYALQPIWECLAARRWTGEQLQTIQQSRCGGTDLAETWRLGAHGERVFLYNHSAQQRLLSQSLRQQLGLARSMRPSDPSLARYYFLAPEGWLYQDLVQLNRYYLDQVIPAFDPDQRFTAAPPFENALMRLCFRAAFGKKYSPGTSAFTLRIAALQTALHQTQIACALERYRLAHGQFPDSLDALVPQYLDKLPHDIMNGQPLKYRRTEDGQPRATRGQFILYSVGWNEKDDGGVVTTKADGGQDIANGDWVLRYPTK